MRFVLSSEDKGGRGPTCTGIERSRIKERRRGLKRQMEDTKQPEENGQVAEDKALLSQDKGKCGWAGSSGTRIERSHVKDWR